MDWREFARTAIEIPFREKGRSWDGIDCWGLVVLGYREVLGIELPCYTEHYESTSELNRLRKVFTRERDAYWREVRRREGAVAMILRRNLRVHVGIVIGRRDILHCEEGAGTILDRDRHLRIEGFWEPDGQMPHP